MRSSGKKGLTLSHKSGTILPPKLTPIRFFKYVTHTTHSAQNYHLWQNHQALAAQLVRDHCFNTELYEDALQEAKLALWEATFAWTEEMHDTFTHYAWLVMRRKLFTYLTEKAVDRPRLSHKDRAVVKAINEHIKAGHALTSRIIEKLSVESDISYFRLGQIISFWYSSSMRITASSYEAAEEMSTEEDEHNDHLLAALDQALLGLSERDRQIIYARFLIDPKRTLQDLAMEHSISIERVRQIEKRAISKLRENLKDFA